MKNEILMPHYDAVLAMISDFQWLSEAGALRLFVEQPARNPVADSLHRVAEDLSLLPPKSTLMDMRVAMGKVLLQQGLVHTCGLREIVDETARVEQFIGTTPNLIGLANLHVTAYALRVRVADAQAWNSFCIEVDRMEWRTSTNGGSTSSMSISLGGGVAEGAEAKVVREDERVDDTSPERQESGEKKPVDKTHPAQDRPRRGLARAFDNDEFNEKADRLLNRHSQEDITAAHTVVSAPVSAPTRCSPFHTVIQEKIAALRTGHKGGKR